MTCFENMKLSEKGEQ